MALTPLSQALPQILATIQSSPDTETVTLADASGRYAAEGLRSSMAVPPADNSAMDGYAVRAQDVPGDLVVSQRIPAGQAPVSLMPGTAARIFTGAEIPAGADAVILQEDAEPLSESVRLPAAPRVSISVAAAVIFRLAINSLRRAVACSPRTSACWHQWVSMRLRCTGHCALPC